MLSERVESWRQAGEMVQIGGRRLYVQQRSGRQPLLLMLHGFPSSSYDWRMLLAARQHNAALAFDCLGFGLSDKPADHLYSLSWQADAAEALVARVGSPPVFIVAHDMGTSVATELIARELAGQSRMQIEGALLFNGSILLHRASPTIGQKLLRGPLGPVAARMTSARSFRLQFARVFSDGHPLTREEAEDQWCLVAHNDGQRIAHRTIHYMRERERFTERWHGAVRDWPGPLSLAWGLKDPVATVSVLEGLRELRPGVPVHQLPALGHYPQLEDPAAIAAALDAALSLR